MGAFELCRLLKKDLDHLVSTDVTAINIVSQVTDVTCDADGSTLGAQTKPALRTLPPSLTLL